MIVIIYLLQKGLYAANIKETKKKGKSSSSFRNTSSKIRGGDESELNIDEINGDLKTFEIVTPTRVIFKSEDKFCVNVIKVSCGHHHTLALADVNQIQ